MKILSLFDGISIARQAITNCGIEIEKYYASEIDKYAIQIAQKNFPNTIQVGSVIDLKGEDFKDIDLIIGGSPCQDLSIAKKNREGLCGSRSGLFWEYVRLRNEIKPKYFILENVNSMPKEAKQTITEALGVEPIMINAALVSAQNRKRLFWIGKLVGDKYEQVKMELPEDRGILLRDILENNVDEKYFVKEHTVKRLLNNGEGFRSKINPEKDSTLFSSMHKVSRGMDLIRIGQLNSGGQGDRIYSDEGKSVNLSANGGGRGAKTGLYAVKSNYNNTFNYNKANTLGSNSQCQTAKTGQGLVDFEKQTIRKLTPIECERLQSLTEIEQSCIIKVCLDHQNNYVNAENKNLKSQSVVGSVEKNDSNENVLSAEKSLNTNNLQTSKPVQQNVLINCEENTFQIHYQNKLLASVSGAEWKQNVRHLKRIEDFVHLIVGLNTIVEKTINGGGVELHQKNNISIEVENGNNVVSLYGKGITQLAKDVEKDLTTPNKLLKSTISDLSIQENNEQIIQTLFSYVVNVIFGYIPKEIQNQNILTFQIKSKVGYTWGVSNTQRYKALGNGFNCKVIEHIFKNLTNK